MLPPSVTKSFRSVERNRLQQKYAWTLVRDVRLTATMSLQTKDVVGQHEGRVLYSSGSEGIVHSKSSGVNKILPLFVAEVKETRSSVNNALALINVGSNFVLTADYKSKCAHDKRFGKPQLSTPVLYMHMVGWVQGFWLQ